MFSLYGLWVGKKWGYGEDSDIERSQYKWFWHLQRMPPGCLHLELFLTRLTGRRPRGRSSFSPFTFLYPLSSYHYGFPFTQNPTGLIADNHRLNMTSISQTTSHSPHPPRLSISLVHIPLLNGICLLLCTYLSRLSVLYRNLLYSSSREACVCRIITL